MPIDFNTLVELSKITSQLNENSVRIEQNLMQKGSFENTTQGKSYTVQLGDSTLILSNKNNSKYSKEDNKKFFEQLMGFDSSDFELSVRGGFAPVNMDTLGRHLSQEYKEYQQQYNSPPLFKRFDTTNYDPVRFQLLSQDPHAKKEVYHKKTVDETRSAIHAEILGLVNGVKRISKPYCQLVDLYFLISGPEPFTHLDMKHPVGSAILKKQGQNKTLREMAYDLGEAISDQKKRFCGLEQGPRKMFYILSIYAMFRRMKNKLLKSFASKEQEVQKEFYS